MATLPGALSVALLAGLLGSLLGTLAGCGAPPADRGTAAVAPGASRGPAASFLLLTLDTTRPDHLAPYGAEDAETPHLQALAEAGAVFELAYAAAPVTLPAHASILTGLDPDTHGVRNNGSHFLPEDLPTLATVLRGEGVTTAAFVSAAVLEARYGLARGFTAYDDDLAAGKPKELRMIAERTAEVTVDAALRWLDGGSRSDGEPREPFFLWVHLFDPHAAYEPPSPWAERFADRPYDGEIAYMDAQIGRLLAHPRIADPRTLVMALGDHGESLGEHGEASHAMLAYDSTLHVPWIVRGPGVAPGARIADPVGQIDLLPTALGLLGLDAAEKVPGLPGRNFGARLRGGPGSSEGTEAAAEPIAPRELYAETFVPFYTYGWAKLRTLRRDGWKYIDAPTPELYHVAEDPGELDERHDVEPERATEMAARLAARTARDGGEAAAVRSLDRETREKLRSLGYLAGSGAVRSDLPGNLPNDRRPDPKEMIDLHRAMDRAEHHLYARDFERAVAELRRILGRDRTNRAALVDLAKALGELGRYDEAVEAAGRALALHPEDPDLHLTLAGLEAARGRPQRALEALDTTLSLDPRSVDAKVEKARLLLRGAREGEDAREAAEARALLEEVLAEDPDHGRAQVLWAEEVEAAAGDLAAAEARLREVTAREPFLAEGWRALGRVRERAGDRDGAKSAYREGLERQPRDPGLLTLLGLLLAEGGSGEDAREAAEARGLLETARELAPVPRAEIHDGLAALAVTRGDWTAAETEARRALEVDPGRAGAWNHLAVALEEQERTERALDAYTRAREADPAYWQAVFNQGLLLRKLGRDDQAMAAFRRVLELVPDHAASHYELGVLHGIRGEDEPAREHLEAALAAAPDHPRAERIRRLLAALR